MLILEQCEGIASLSKWKLLPGKVSTSGNPSPVCVVGCTLVPFFAVNLSQDSQAAWMWFENMNGRWCHYPPDVVKKIEKSYREGEDCYRYERKVAQ